MPMPMPTLRLKGFSLLKCLTSVRGVVPDPAVYISRTTFALYAAGPDDVLDAHFRLKGEPPQQNQGTSSISSSSSSDDDDDSTSGGGDVVYGMRLDLNTIIKFLHSARVYAKDDIVIVNLEEIEDIVSFEIEGIPGKRLEMPCEGGWAVFKDQSPDIEVKKDVEYRATVKVGSMDFLMAVGQLREKHCRNMTDDETVHISLSPQGIEFAMKIRVSGFSILFKEGQKGVTVDCSKVEEPVSIRIRLRLLHDWFADAVLSSVWVTINASPGLPLGMGFYITENDVVHYDVMDVKGVDVV